ncbi:arsenic transporter, partial [Micromonospora fluostatini]
MEHTVGSPPRRSTRHRPHPLDLAATALAVAGAGCVLSGLLPRAEATATVARILP